MSKLRIAGIIKESVVDGPGIRFVIFVQGCIHNCEGCHNPETHRLDAGKIVETEDILQEIKKNPLLTGVTFSGGEPFLQASACGELARQIHKIGLNIITYTGYQIETLMNKMNEENSWRDLLMNTDILIDGKFVLAEKSLMLRFRGSRNQRIIDPLKSLEMKTAVEIDF